MSDWKIMLEPHGDPEYRGDGCLEVLAGDEQDAVEALEGWAETIAALGYVPEGLDWRNRSGAAITRRAGRLRFAARVDSFERELPSGDMSSGTGWLVARPA